MEFNIIQTSNKEDKVLEQKIEGGKKGRSSSNFYQKAKGLPTSPRREEEQEKKLEEAILPKLQDPKKPKIFHAKSPQHGQNLDGIQGQRGKKNETTPFPKEITLSSDVLNTLKEIENIILPLKDIKNILSSLEEINSSLLSLIQTVVKN
ncbi:hypothetical protein O181_025570 [Austropuccinia psidii MF-1]|uniref:Uncharacterized protein n=1 Tax=Austropuccinia psidii MF-1 TaxID=1389203 RepID=A0A9Q3CMQ4_9BASI|nr:hypothetical protein [Austropuccinia psidii MF-1]